MHEETYDRVFGKSSRYNDYQLDELPFRDTVSTLDALGAIACSRNSVSGGSIILLSEVGLESKPAEDNLVDITPRTGIKHLIHTRIVAALIPLERSSSRKLRKTFRPETVPFTKEIAALPVGAHDRVREGNPMRVEVLVIHPALHHFGAGPWLDSSSLMEFPA
jgi:hypothetical protein